jgi:LPXTG-motif cell wall-anchored protein
VRTLAQLPYTGFGLALFVVLGLILVATGLTTRKRARLSV